MKVSRLNPKGQGGVPQLVLGLRVSAIAETIAFLVLALIVDHILGAGDRFSEITPHPFWIIVLLVSTYYGTNEGLAAAGLCAIALLVGHIPEQGFNEERTAWLLRITADPVLWILAALLLGEISSGRRRKNMELADKVAASQKQIVSITDAYEALSEAKSSLEVRVAAQGQTVRTVYQASRFIEQQTASGVTEGVAQFVRAIIAPEKFSLFLLNGQELTAEIRHGWQRSDEFEGTFPPSSALYEAVVGRREFQFIANPMHEAVLRRQGIIAGPVIDPGTGHVIGMLKIEEMDFARLHPSTLQNFKIACDWIGAAYANAAQTPRREYFPSPTQKLLPDSLYDSQRASLTDLAREAHFDACALYASFEIESGTAIPSETSIASAVQQAAAETLSPNNLRFSFGKAGWTYAILLPEADAERADDIAQSFTRRVCEMLSSKGHSVRSRYLVEILYQESHVESVRLGARADG